MKRPKVTGLRRRESWQALPFLLPSLLGLCLFYLFPLAETVRASFMDPLRSRAVGWGNYRALFQNTAFRLAVRNTCRFLCICIPALLAVSLLCAVLLGAAKRRAVFFKSVLLLPYAIPVASIVVLWRALFSGKGLVNGLLVGLGCRPVDFMGSSAAFWVLIFTYLWRNNGYDMLLWLAGLETIPRPLYEAAAVDGATPFQTFVFITLPNLLPTVVLTTILSLVNSFKVFREAYLVAGNYPQESIYLLQHLFNNWFLSLDIGKLSAAAVLLEANTEGFGVVDSILHSDGSGEMQLYMKAGGSRYPASVETVQNNWHTIMWDGHAVFKAAVSKMSDVSVEMMERHNLKGEDIRFLVPHQANLRIIDATARRMGITQDKCMINIDRNGNTTAATIPSCLCDYESQLRKGDNLILSAFGGGYTWGATYVKWAYDGLKA